MKLGMIVSAVFFIFSCAFAGVDSSISGNVLDTDQVAVPGAKVQLQDSSGHVLKETTSSTTGEFSFFPVQFGSYQVVVTASGFAANSQAIAVASGANPHIDVNLISAKNKELILNVKEKRNMVTSSTSGSARDIDQQQIAEAPRGDDISLPRLLATTTPGIIQGPFGQMFIRGNHANIQYQIDGVQLPDSGSGTFGDAFSPRNVDHMEVITGGIPAEYGERLSAVVNIVTKSGTEKPGGTAEISYGSYNTLTPQVNFGGSDSTGRIHYFGSLSYTQTDRGLDTPQPMGYDNQTHGGADAVHDKAHAHEEFARVDDVVDNDNKFTVTAFNSNRFFQVPNYPDKFLATDPFFNQAGYTDVFGNQNQDPTKTTFNWVPSNTNDNQTEQDSYLEFVWKHSFTDNSFVQVAPYMKISSLVVNNDPTNDLATSSTGTNSNPNAQPDSFALNRTTTNIGLKTDYTWRVDSRNLVKTGFQVQNSSSKTNNLSIQQDLATAPFTYSGSDTGNMEAAYIQDSYSLTKALTFNFGLRYTGTQFKSDDISTSDGLLQPRLGVEYFLFDTTKLHAFYGKLFQPAPFENLRKAFVGTGGGGIQDYDIKAEKDDYYEVGVTQQVGGAHAIGLNYYYKNATDMMDDAQLLNTSIAQPYNFAHGYATGVEFSLSGQLTNNLSDFFNYSYEIAKGRSIDGGFFAFDPRFLPPDQFLYLDHVQINTANAGMTYTQDQTWATVEALYGSGLRSGPNNSVSLPSHMTFDATIGYKTKGDDALGGVKVAFDVVNIGNDSYPITVNNGFNGSHYAAGREYYIHLGKDF